MLRHPGATDRVLFEEHLNDSRVNHLLYTNGDLARICLRVIDLRGAAHLSDADRKFVNQWTSDDQ